MSSLPFASSLLSCPRPFGSLLNPQELRIKDAPKRRCNLHLSSPLFPASSVFKGSRQRERIFQTWSATRHPYDPHYPNSGALLPQVLKPYPAFEGWFTRIVNPSTSESFGVILATNNATKESQVTLIVSSSESRGKGSTSPAAELVQKPRVTAEITKDAYWTQLEIQGVDLESDSLFHEGKDKVVPAFQWEANGVGLIRVDPQGTLLDVSIQGTSLIAELTNQMPWDSDNAFVGPEGWATSIPYLPTRWFVRSLSSSVVYQFHDSKNGGTMVQGTGIGHEEKNWGQGFPLGHVWAQGFSKDNSAQLVISGALFNAGPIASPYVFAGAYRSPNLSLDFRSNDLGTSFTDPVIDYQSGKFSVTVTTLKHVLQIHVEAPPNSFSSPILAPRRKNKWDDACRESYCAMISLRVYSRSALRLMAPNDLIESRLLSLAALEFGEQLC